MKPKLYFMIVKVCGLTNQDNLDRIIDAGAHWAGFNYYPKSKRFLPYKRLLLSKADTVKRVGVFVNDSIENIKNIAELHRLDIIQLHGGESSEYCRTIGKEYTIIKVFSIDTNFKFEKCTQFDFCDFFLFDTKSKSFGGSGKKFEWSKIQEYTMDIPFLLAGGIQVSDLEMIKSLNHDKLIGIDINSGFEIKAGIKNPVLIDSFIKNLKR